MQTEAPSHLAGNEITLACFRSLGREYAIDVTLVREIVRRQEITLLPDAPELIEGVVELRGAIIPVLDLNRVLGGEAAEITNRSRIVVLDFDGMLLGFCVEAATDVLSLDPALLEDVPELAIQAGYDTVRAVVRREDGPPVMVLSVETMIEKVYRSALAKSGDS